MSRELVSIEATKNHEAASYPHYRRDLLCTMGHLGLGGFHRAHLERYADELNQDHEGNVLFHGVGMLEQDKQLIDNLRDQGGLYTLIERSGTEDSIRVIGSLKEVSLGPSDPAAVIEAFSQENIKIISLTVTEKGYYNTPAGDLDTKNERVQNDLADSTQPMTVHGYLYAIAERRMRSGGQPFTVMSCDNLPGNGSMTQRLLLEFAALKNPDNLEVVEWIRNNVAFPNSMVDRITPVPTDETRQFVRDTYGVDDKAPVAAESFIQWIVEDNFANGRPAFEEVGVQFVPSVEPYEALKTRMLNGAHSALAYTSYLMGYRKVDQAMSDPLIEKFLKRYMDDDITPTLPDVPGIDIEDYKITLRKRFANPAVSDQIQRLAMDGSAKINNFIVPPLEHQLRAGGSIKWMAFALAAWSKYLSGADESGSVIEINDPLSDELVGKVTTASDLLARQDIFGPEISRSERLSEELDQVMVLINELGTRQALEQLLAS